MQFLISAEWIQQEADARGIKSSRQGGPEGVRGPEEAVLPEGEGLPGVPQDLGPDRGGPALPRPARRPLQPGPPEDRRGQGQGHRQGDHRLLQQEQVALRDARDARPERRPHREGGRRRQGQGRARGRQVVQGGREEVLDRRGLQVAGRQAAGGREGPAGEGARRGRLQGQEGRAGRPGQDPVRLLRLRGHEGQAGQPADARGVEGVDPRPAQVAEGAEGARRVRQGLPGQVPRQDRVRRRLQEGPRRAVQERRQAQGHDAAGADAAPGQGAAQDVPAGRWGRSRALRSRRRPGARGPRRRARRRRALRSRATPQGAP